VFSREATQLAIAENGQIFVRFMEFNRFINGNSWTSWSELKGDDAKQIIDNLKESPDEIHAGTGLPRWWTLYGSTPIVGFKGPNRYRLPFKVQAE